MNNHSTLPKHVNTASLTATLVVTKLKISKHQHFKAIIKMADS